MRVEMAVAIAVAGFGGVATANTFDIELVIEPGGIPDAGTVTTDLSERQVELVEGAAAYWEGILTGFSGVDEATHRLEIGMAPFAEAGLESELGNNVARGAVFATEATGGFTRATEGLLALDEDDFGSTATDPLGDDHFLATVIHEMGHTLGFGTLWFENGLVGLVSSESGFVGNYTGSEALGVYNEVFDSSKEGIRPDNNLDHWSECWVALLDDPGCSSDGGVVTDGDGELVGSDLVLSEELMTEISYEGEERVLSPVTIAAFRDLGYATVNPLVGAGPIPTVAEILGQVSEPQPASSGAGGDVPAPVPLPASSVLLLGGLGGLAALRRRSGRTAACRP